MRITYLVVEDGRPIQKELKKIISLHVGQGHTAYLYFVADGKEYKSEGMVWVEDNE